MGTGACGVDCGVCKLNIMEICSSCGSGKSLEGAKKLEAQKRILGNPCPILACASMNKIEYCMKDCLYFPCDNFRAGPYPFSHGFLSMQERRRKEKPPALTHNRAPLQVPSEYWDTLATKDITALCNLTLGNPFPPSGLIFRSLGKDIWIDIEHRCLKKSSDGNWLLADDPLLELLSLIYLNNVASLHPLSKDLVGVQDLKEAHYFKGHHALKTDSLLRLYGNNLEGFRKAAEYLEGKPVAMADGAYMLLPFPRVAVYYLLWVGDEEFSPKLSVLFDRSIECYFTASAIWSLVNLVTAALIKGPEIIS